MVLNFPVEHIVNFLTKDSIFNACAVKGTFVTPKTSDKDIQEITTDDMHYLQEDYTPTYSEAQMQIENVIKRFLVLCPLEVTGLLHGCWKFCEISTQNEGHKKSKLYEKRSDKSFPWIRNTPEAREFQSEALRRIMDALKSIGVQMDEVDFVEETGAIIDYIDSNTDVIFTRSKVTPRGFYNIFCKETGIIQHLMGYVGAFLRQSWLLSEEIDVPTSVTRHFPFDYRLLGNVNAFDYENERTMVSLNDSGFLAELEGTGAKRDQVVVMLAYAGVNKAKVFPFVVDWMWKRVERDHGIDHKQAFNIAAMFSTHVVKKMMTPLLESGFVKGDDVIPEETYQSLCAYFKKEIGEPFMTEDPEAAEKERKEWVDKGLYIEGKLTAEQVRLELVHSESSLAPKSEPESQLWLFGGVAALAGFFFLRR